MVTIIDATPIARRGADLLYRVSLSDGSTRLVLAGANGQNREIYT